MLAVRTKRRCVSVSSVTSSFNFIFNSSDSARLDYEYMPEFESRVRMLWHTNEFLFYFFCSHSTQDLLVA